MLGLRELWKFPEEVLYIMSLSSLLGQNGMCMVTWDINSIVPAPVRTPGRSTAALSQSYPSMGPCLAWPLGCAACQPERYGAAGSRAAPVQTELVCVPVPDAAARGLESKMY